MSILNKNYYEIQLNRYENKKTTHCDCSWARRSW